MSFILIFVFYFLIVFNFVICLIVFDFVILVGLLGVVLGSVILIRVDIFVEIARIVDDVFGGEGQEWESCAVVANFLRVP